MNCHNHQITTAVAICGYCGMALCPECLNKTERNRIVCSVECGQKSDSSDSTIEAIADKIQRSNRAASWFSIGFAILAALLGVVMLKFGTDASSIFFGIVLAVLGVINGRYGVSVHIISKRKSNKT